MIINKDGVLSLFFDENSREQIKILDNVEVEIVSFTNNYDVEVDLDIELGKNSSLNFYQFNFNRSSSMCGTPTNIVRILFYSASKSIWIFLNY